MSKTKEFQLLLFSLPGNHLPGWLMTGVRKWNLPPIWDFTENYQQLNIPLHASSVVGRQCGTMPKKGKHEIMLHFVKQIIKHQRWSGGWVRTQHDVALWAGAEKKRGGVSEEMPHDDGITLRANLHIQNVIKWARWNIHEVKLSPRLLTPTVTSNENVT